MEHVWTDGPLGKNYHCSVCSITKIDDHHCYNTCESYFLRRIQLLERENNRVRISEMQSGKEMDALIAKYCFNFEYSVVPKYSTDMREAWSVVGWIIDRTRVFDLVWDHTMQHWECSYKEEAGGDYNRMTICDSPAKAICMAALELYYILQDEE